ncbi:MAG: hypothetical protein ACI3VB_06785 [Oscillospiraceae bacterium]
MRACPHCRKQISEFAVSCPFCGNELLKEKSVIGNTASSTRITSPIKYKHIAVATLISILVPLTCQLISSCFYLIYGSDVVSAFMIALWFVVVRSILVLIASGLMFWAVSKISRFNTTQGFVIVAIVCTAIHFLILALISTDNIYAWMHQYVYAWMYEYSVTAVRVHTVAYGIGSSVLMGCLCIILQNKKNQHTVFSVSAITLSFAIFSILAAFISVRLLQQGITGGFLSVCGAIVAIAVTVIVKTKFEQ